MADKKVVQYRQSDAFIPGVGGSAIVFAYQHPDAIGVPAGTDDTVYTTAIVSHDSNTGEFETKNTRYVPKK